MQLKKENLVQKLVDAYMLHQADGEYIAISMGAMEQTLAIRDVMMDGVDVSDLYTIADESEASVVETLNTISLTSMYAGEVVDGVLQATPQELFEDAIATLRSNRSQTPKIMVLLVDVLASALARTKGYYVCK